MKKILIKKALRKRANLRSLRRDLSSLLDLLGLDDVEISLLLVGNQRIRTLNRLYRGIDKTTDVLSFRQMDIGDQGSGALRHPCNALPFLSLRAKRSNLKERLPRTDLRLPTFVLGDIVLNLNQIKKQAIENHVSFKDELRLMLTHGLLHLLGYDHEKDRQSAKKMRFMERKLLNALKKLDRKCK